MAVNVLDEMLVQLRAVLTQYEQQERELRQALDQVVQAELMQAGAVRGVEMAIQTLTRPLPGGEGVGITDSPDSADGTD